MATLSAQSYVSLTNLLYFIENMWLAIIEIFIRAVKNYGLSNIQGAGENIIVCNRMEGPSSYNHKIS